MKFFRGIYYTLAHFLVAISLTMLTFHITDRFNPTMAFIDHEMTKSLMTVFSWIIIFECSIILVKFICDGRYALSIFPTLAIIAAVAILCFIFADLTDPSKILFTKKAIKAAVAFEAVSGLASAVTIICFMRKIAYSRFNSENKKTPIKD